MGAYKTVTQQKRMGHFSSMKLVKKQCTLYREMDVMERQQVEETFSGLQTPSVDASHMQSPLRQSSLKKTRAWKKVAQLKAT